MSSSELKAFTALAGLFIGFLVIANVLAVKPVALGTRGIVVSSAALVYSLTYLITDTISELWGKEYTRSLIFTGFLTSVVVALFVRLAVAFPAADFWGDQEAFVAVLAANWRIVLASMGAYLVSQLHDVWAFEFWRAKTQGRHLWLRNIASTGVSQLLDTALFTILAFAGVWPWYGIWATVVGEYVIKLLIALFDTPLIYALVGILRRRLGLPAERRAMLVGG